MKKILTLLAFIFLIELPAPAAQEVIELDLKDNHQFAENIIAQNMEIENPVLETEPESTKNPSVFQETIQKNEQDKAETQVQTQDRSGIADYDPTMGGTSPKFFLFNAITKAANDVINWRLKELMCLHNF